MNDRIIAGKYALTGEIARGGMGVIHRADHVALKRTVAIKILHPQFGGDPALQRRFQREARAMARLDHDNIIRVFDVGEEEGSSYLVMEYFPGQDLRQFVREHGAFSVSETLEIALRVAQALAYAHAHGIVHRDIKPGNIMIDADRRVKIADFGIAVATDEASLTTAGEVMGTPEYMSPEQARGQAVDARSDLYSTGVVICHMLTGKTPFSGLSGMAIIGRLVTEQGGLEAELPEGTPPGLVEIVRTLLRYDPAERIQTAVELAERLQALRQESAPAPSSADDTLPPRAEPLGFELLSPSAEPPKEPPRPKRGRRFSPWLALGAVVSAALLVALYWYFSPAASQRLAEQRVRAVEERTAEVSRLRSEANIAAAPRLSPDLWAAAVAKEAASWEAFEKGKQLMAHGAYPDAVEALGGAEGLFGEAAGAFREARTRAEARGGDELSKLQEAAQRQLDAARHLTTQVAEAQRQAEAKDAKQHAAGLRQEAQAQADKAAEAVRAGERWLAESHWKDAKDSLDQAVSLLTAAREGFRSAQELAERKAIAPPAPGPGKPETVAYAEGWVARGTDEPDLNKRIIYYTKALEYEPKFYPAYFNRGFAYFQTGQYQQALADYDAALRLQPDAAEVYVDRGNVHLQLRDYASALKDYDQALQRSRGRELGDPEFAATLRINRGNAYFYLGQYAQALDEYGKAVALQPNQAEAWADRARAYRSLGENERARDDYAKALELDPNNAAVHNNLAWLLIDSGLDRDQGVALAERALKLQPSNGTILDTLGWGYYKQGNYPRAVETLMRAREADPANEEFAAHLRQASQALNTSRQ